MTKKIRVKWKSPEWYEQRRAAGRIGGAKTKAKMLKENPNYYADIRRKETPEDCPPKEIS